MVVSSRSTFLPWMVINWFIGGPIIDRKNMLYIIYYIYIYILIYNIYTHAHHTRYLQYITNLKHSRSQMGSIFVLLLTLATIIFNCHAFSPSIKTRKCKTSFPLMGFTDFFKPKTKSKVAATTPIKFR